MLLKVFWLLMLIAAAICLFGSSLGYENDRREDDDDFSSNFRPPAILKRNMATSSKKVSPRNDAKFMCVFCTMSPHICDPLRACYPSFFMPSNS